MKTLKSALLDASDAFLRQVEEHNVIPGSDTIRYYESGVGNVYWKTWMGFLIPEDAYVQPMENRNLWPSGIERRNSVWDVITANIFEVHNCEDVDGLDPAQILYCLQGCYHRVIHRNGTVNDIADEVSEKVHEGQLPSWCDELLKKRGE